MNKEGHDLLLRYWGKGPILLREGRDGEVRRRKGGPTFKGREGKEGRGGMEGKRSVPVVLNLPLHHW